MNGRGTGLAGLRDSFGEQSVGSAARRALVRDLFNRVAPRYDLMNDLMSLGLHRLWKRHTADATARVVRTVEGPVLDLAGGTGDLSFLMQARMADRLIVNSDASAGMLGVAARRADGGLPLAVSEAESLPFADRSLAAVTLGFGLRNMTDPQAALREVFRVLRPGGTLLLLEFSKPARWFAPAYDLYSRYVIPLLGTLVAGDRRAYRYLVESIRRFPDAASITRELQGCGFAEVRITRFMFGVAALHLARRPSDT